MAENTKKETKHEGLEYKDNVRPVMAHHQAEVPMGSQDNTTLSVGSFSANSTHIQQAAWYSYALAIFGSSNEDVPVAEDGVIPIADQVTRVISEDESTWKRMYEALLSRVEEEAGSTAHEVPHDSSPDQNDQSEDGEPTLTRSKKKPRRRVILGTILCFVICLLAFAIIVPIIFAVVRLFSKNGPGNDPEFEVPPEPTLELIRQNRTSEIISFLNSMTFSGRELQYDVNSTHPSDMALVWIIEDRMQLTVAKDRDHLLQRFALMTFILGRNDKETLVGSDYLHECDPNRFSVFNDLWHCKDGLITEITASGVGLSGPLPDDVALFPGLVLMNFRNNSWTGPIPSSIGTMTQLKSLGLANNKFTGTIPSSLSLLTGLTTMDLDSNQLTGTIPSSIGDMINLRWLQLSNNNLAGNVPSTLGNLTRLSKLWLQGNRLSGTLPPELAQHPPRDVLLYRNEFTGPVPYCAGNSTQCVVLAADCNRVECPCCSNCCPQSTGRIPVYKSCAL